MKNSTPSENLRVIAASIFGLRQIPEREVTVRCPFHDDHTPSCSVNFEKGVYFCHACNAKGNFFTLINNESTHPTLISKCDGEPIKKTLAHKSKTGKLPSDAELIELCAYRSDPVEGIYRYSIISNWKDGDSEQVACKIRFKTANGKDFSWIYKGADDEIVWSKPKHTMPMMYGNFSEIYNSKNRVTVYLVEGEKCVNVLVQRNKIAITLGSKSELKRFAEIAQKFPLNIDWILCPDNDEDGKEAMDACSNSLSRLFIAHSLVEIEKVVSGQGDDIADLPGDFDLNLLPVRFVDPGKKRYPRLSNLIERDYPEEVPLWGPIMPRSINLLAGAAGTGKSMLIEELMVRLSHGEPFLGSRPSRVLNVALLDGELSASTLKKRLSPMLHSMSRSNLRNTSDPIVICRDTLAELKGDSADLDLFMKEDIDFVENNLPPDIDLLIVDNITRFFPGGRELEPAYWSDVYKILLGLQRRRDFAVLLIHHSSRSNRGTPAGHSYNERAMDSILIMERPEAFSKSDILADLEIYKNRHGVKFDNKKVKFVTEMIEGVECSKFVELEGSCMEAQSCNEGLQQEIAALLGQRYSIRDIAKELGVTRYVVERARKKIGVAREEVDCLTAPLHVQSDRQDI